MREELHKKIFPNLIHQEQFPGADHCIISHDPEQVHSLCKTVAIDGIVWRYKFKAPHLITGNIKNIQAHVRARFSKKIKGEDPAARLRKKR